MSKIVLTSTGLSSRKVIDTVVELSNKPIENNKVLFINTASLVCEDNEYVKWDVDGLKQAGFIIINITDISDDLLLDDIDVLYICGGNTFYLLESIRKHHFDKKIIDFINSNKLYIGSSAGSIILSSTIENALDFDKNDVKMQDFKGLSLIEDVIIPHANEKQEFIKETKNKYQKIITINNDDCVIIK